MLSSHTSGGDELGGLHGLWNKSEGAGTRKGQRDCRHSHHARQAATVTIAWQGQQVKVHSLPCLKRLGHLRPRWQARSSTRLRC